MKILHYIEDFSLPSETFVYDAISALDKQKEIENVVVTNRRHLEKERPFKKNIGFREGTHTAKKGDNKKMLERHELEFPLKHPNEVEQEKIITKFSRIFSREIYLRKDWLD